MARPYNNLKAVISKPDDQVAIPSTTRNTVNLMGQVTALDIGQCCSRVERVPVDMTIKEFMDQSAELKNALRNNMAPSVRGAKSKTGGEYSVEITTAVTTPGQLYLVGIVTRIG